MKRTCLRTLGATLAVCFMHLPLWGWSQAQGNFLKKQSRDNYSIERSRNQLEEVEASELERSYFQNDTTLIVGAQVLYNAKPHAYVAIFSLVQIAATTDSVNRLMNERIEAFRRTLQSLGISGPDVFVDMISLEAKYETQLEKKAFSKRAVEVPAGFELAKNVHVRYRSESLIHDIMTAAVPAEIYDLVKVDYFIPHLEAIYDTLQRTAAQLILRKRAAFQQVGVDFDPHYVALMEEQRHAFYPIELYAEYISSSRTSLEVVKKGKATVLPERIRSSFYSKPSYTRYDQVFNPIVLEPMVHISYALKVRYLVRKNVLSPPPVVPAPATIPALSISPGQLILVPSDRVTVPR